MPRKRKAVVLTDPRAIRALAHPARQRLIDELYGGRVLTATECAELVGLSPSAVSYHLRALAGWGIVERAAPTADGRQRPWRAPATRLVLSAPPGVAGRAAAQAAVQTQLDRLRELLESVPDEDPWQDVDLVNVQRLWLTKPEMDAFQRELRRVVSRHRHGRTDATRPANTRLVNAFIATVPIGDPPPGDDVSGR